MRLKFGFIKRELLNAINNNDLAVAKKLCKTGLKLDPEQGEIGPLSLCMDNNNEEMYDLLVKYGANPGHKYRGRNVLIYGILGDINRTFPFKLLGKLLQGPVKRQVYDMEIWEHMSPIDVNANFTIDKWCYVIDETVPNMKTADEWDKNPGLMEAYRGKIKFSVRNHFGHEQELIDWALLQGRDSKHLLNAFLATHSVEHKGSCEYDEMLLRAGADANLTGSEGTTILMAKARHSDIQCIKTFLEHGANINASDCWGRTAMYSAARRRQGSGEIIRLLASHGADINARSSDGVTPLAWASMLYKRTESVKTLIELGADVNIVNNYGMTALDKAEESLNPECVDLLLRAGAKRGSDK